MCGKSEVIINHVLLERILEIKHSNYLHDESLCNEELIEQIKLTRLGEMAESLSKEEMATLVLIAVQNDPEMVFQILMQEYLINKDMKGRKK